MDRLAAHSPIEAQVVKLRFFVGMTAAESAEVLGLSERTVKQYWSHARTWLYREIQSKKARRISAFQFFKIVCPLFLGISYVLVNGPISPKTCLGQQQKNRNTL